MQSQNSSNKVWPIGYINNIPSLTDNFNHNVKAFSSITLNLSVSYIQYVQDYYKYCALS